MKDVRSTIKEGIARLRAAGVPSYTLAAELLLMHAARRDRLWLYAHAEEPLDATTLADYLALVEKRCAGVPTQYLTGKQEFWGLEFHVEPGVLIPRPETEHVIEVALERLGHRRPKRIADAGTGSGCLAVTLAREFPEAEVCATDISTAALAVAQRNAERHGVAGRVRLVHGSLLEPFLPASCHARAVPFELIVSNPPYVGLREADLLPREVRQHEPQEALFAGEEGGELYPALIDQTSALLAPGGLLVLELGYNSLPRVYPLLCESSGEQQAAPPRSWQDVRITHDLAGIPRVISAIRS